MPTTDTSEKGLETLIVAALTGQTRAAPVEKDVTRETLTPFKGKDSWFLSFNKGYNDGAGNPPNPNGLKTDYLWREILTREGLTDIIENYAQIVKEKNEKTGKKREVQIFPRYHQLDVVRKLLADTRSQGAGRRYLIQHSSGWRRTAPRFSTR